MSIASGFLEKILKNVTDDIPESLLELTSFRPKMPDKPAKPKMTITQYREIWNSEFGDISLSAILRELPPGISPSMTHLRNEKDSSGQVIVRCEYENNVPNTKYKSQLAEYETKMRQYERDMKRWIEECKAWQKKIEERTLYLRRVGAFIEAELETYSDDS